MRTGLEVCQASGSLPRMASGSLPPDHRVGAGDAGDEYGFAAIAQVGLLLLIFLFRAELETIPRIPRRGCPAAMSVLAEEGAAIAFGV
jgi:hypothetical protein